MALKAKSTAKRTKREPMHESRSKLAKNRVRDKNGRYIGQPK